MRNKLDLTKLENYVFYKAGVQAEQERIIKLLEEHTPNSSDHDFVGCECEYPTNTWYNDHLIALIKGEQK